MTQYFAFLRAINVGGRTVKMDELRSIFENLGFHDVATFIASGNVIFQSPESDATTIEQRAETGLREALGYDVETFLRTGDELTAAATCRPFSAEDHEAAMAFNVGFAYRPLSSDAEQALLALQTDQDQLAVRGREIYWLCRVRQSDSQIKGNKMAKAIGMPATFRSINTLERLLKKFPSA